MKSGGAVLIIAALQVVFGLCLLGIYEGYKVHYMSDVFYYEDSWASAPYEKASPGASFAPSPQSNTTDSMYPYFSDPDFQTPMDFVFYFSIVANVFSIIGIAGLVLQQRELVFTFFTYNLVAVVVVFHYFVDICADVGIRYRRESPGIPAYVQAAAAFLFFSFVLSGVASTFGFRAIEEIRSKQREEYHRMAALGETLQFEPDTV